MRSFLNSLLIVLIPFAFALLGFGIFLLEFNGFLIHWVNIGSPNEKIEHIFSPDCFGVYAKTTNGNIYMYYENAGSTWQLQDPNNLHLPIPNWEDWGYRRPTRLTGMIEMIEDSSGFPEASCYSAFALRNDGKVYWWRHWVYSMILIPKIVIYLLGFFLLGLVVAFVVLIRRVRPRRS